MNYEYCDGYTYTIKKGDTLYEISRSHKVPLSLLLRSNPFVDVFNLQVGDTLCIPTRQSPSRPCEVWGDCEDDERPERPDRPTMPNRPEMPNRPGMPGQPGRPDMPGGSDGSGMPNMPGGSGGASLPGNSGGSGSSGRPGTLQPSETPDTEVKWERYVVRPGDTMAKVLDGNMSLLQAFGDRNGWDHVYLLPGVAYFVPEED